MTFAFPKILSLGLSVFPLLLLLLLRQCSGSIVINEVASKGTTGVCSGHDWVELYNRGIEEIDLSDGYVLHDDKGIEHEDAFEFPYPTTMEPQSYLVLCTKIRYEEDSLLELPDPSSPQFGIGSQDTLTLVRVSGALAANGTATSITTAQARTMAYQIVSSVGPLPDTTDNDFDVTYALDPTTGMYNYTSTPTPAEPNVITELLTQEEKDELHKVRLAEQNAWGTQFFNMDERGLPVADGMDEVLNLYITMSEEDYQYTVQNASQEIYRPFESMRLTTVEGNKEIADFTSPGRIRPKGQTTLYISQCLGTDTMPFQVDMDSEDATQTLFGVGRFYLRTHMSDNSYMRDYAYNRMLARFGLPYLRARTVQLFLNDKKTGLYTLMEAPDNEFVFARNFPTYSPQSFSLYKVTNLGVTCGQYTNEQIANATRRISETSTPPYNFERGEHRRPVATLDLLSEDQCTDNYWHDVETLDMEDVVLAWLRYNKDCAKMRMEEGLMDRDLGKSEWDDVMEDFLRDHLDQSQDRCEPTCANSNLAEDVDVENFLKTMAFYAVTLNQDSPLGNGNNYYLANAGDGTGWKLQAYDFNFAFPAGCQEVCNERLVHWSIVRPTCQSLESNQIAGPLLTDPVLQSQYLEYVREFVDTVYGNSSLIDQLTLHVNTIREYAAQDVYSVFGAFLDREQSVDAAPWNASRYPLLPIMKARAEDVNAQLQALEDGTFARGPIVADEDNEPLEVCADWRQSEPDTSKCRDDCRYSGCHMDGWTVESYCDEENEICYHGDYDESCRNIKDGEQYQGMENRDDGRETFCRFAQGLPIKASECPSVTNSVVSVMAEEETPMPSPTESSGAPLSVAWVWSASAIIVSLFMAMTM